MTTTTRQILLGTDDADELNDLPGSLTHTYLYLGCMSGSNVYDIGLRWQSLNIPQRQRIVSAKLSMYIDSDVGTLSANIKGIAEDNPDTWASTDRPSQRAKTSAVITANESNWNNWGTGGWIDIDISAVIQEIVDRAGWAEFNALAIVLEDTSGAASNYIAVRAYEQSTHTYGAKLEIVHHSGDAQAEDLVLYLPFNDGSGTSARDDSGRGNNGALQNMDDSNWVPGKSGDALDLNGTDEYVICAHSSSLDIINAITISAWIKLDATTGWQTICSKMGTSDATSAIYFYTFGALLGLRLFHSGGSILISQGGALSAGVWHHVVGTYDGSNQKIFIDAIPVDVSSGTISLHSISNDILIGSNERWAGEMVSGLIDEVRVYDRALAATDIAWLYNHPSGTMENVPSGRVCFTDADGDGHTISDLMSLQTTTSLTRSSDTVNFDLLNTDDRYAWLERGCEIEVLTGMGGVNTPKLLGFVTEVTRTLDSSGTVPHIYVHGESIEIRLNNILFSGRFYNIEVSALLIAIIDLVDFTTGETYRTLAGIDASNSGIDSTAYTIDEASYTWKSIGAAIKELAELVGFGWYIDTDAVLHFFDPTTEGVIATITDSDLEGPPTISNEGSITNRAIVIGGFQQQTDQSGNGHPSFATVSSGAVKNQSFVPTEDYMGSVLVYTELVTSSTSDILISVQADSASAPDGVYLSNSQHTILKGDIIDAGFSEFRFERPVTLTPGSTYWLVLSGTTGLGVKVGIDGSAVLDYKTRYPSQVAVMANDTDSYLKHGLYSAIHRDTKIEDAQIAETKAGEMLITASRKTAALTIRGDSRKAGEIVQLTLTTVGVMIDATMQIVSSTQIVKDRFIYNNLEMVET